MAWACTTMTTNILVCKWMVRTDWPVNIYSLFLFKNFTDTAAYCADLSNASASLYESSFLITRDELLGNLIFLFLMVWAAYYILHKYLTKAVEYTRLLPVWNYLAAIPVLFSSCSGWQSAPCPLPACSSTILTWLFCCLLVCLYLHGPLCESEDSVPAG